MGSEPRPGQELKEASNNDVNEVKTRRTVSWAYGSEGDPAAGGPAQSQRLWQ